MFYSLTSNHTYHDTPPSNLAATTHSPDYIPTRVEATIPSLGDSPSGDAVTNLARDVRTCSEIAEPGGHSCRRDGQKPVDASRQRGKTKEAIDLIQGAMGNNVNLAVLSFGRDAAIEQSPQSGKFAGFVNEVHGDASDLNGAIEKAMALIRRARPADCSCYRMADGPAKTHRE